ncbi:MAG: ABC transporter substrate-binding protein [Herpetosiphonaceae bacterium]|nr:MAG: ABC transporter substrate-binding protein [Herpetosiphonaceae bacterium]
MPDVRWLVFVILLLGMLAACGIDAAEEPDAATGLERSAAQAALEIAGGQRLGGKVTVLGAWEGSELEAFLAMVKPFQEATSVSVLFHGTRNLDSVLSRRLHDGNPPDLAGLPGPGQLPSLARRGALVDLETILDMQAIEAQYAQEWLDLGTVDGRFVGIFIRASVKGLVWYNPQVWRQQGFAIPESWEALMDLSRRMAGSSAAPWCLGLESDAASGWPGTDWIENILLRQQGSEVYDRWYQGEFPWTSPEVRQAWQTWGAIVTDPEMIYGGPSAALTTSFAEAGDPLFDDPPGCLMYQQASFITDFFTANNPGVRPGEDFDFFVMPAFDGSGQERLEVAGDLFGMFNDTPQSSGSDALPCHPRSPGDLGPAWSSHLSQPIGSAQCLPRSLES